MTLIQSIIEVFLLTGLLAGITLICLVCHLSILDSIVALSMGGSSYLLTVFTRTDTDNFTDKHLKR